VLKPGERYKMVVEAPGFITQESQLHARTINGTREIPMDILMMPGEQRLTRNE
jgi:hypothetical protein